MINESEYKLNGVDFKVLQALKYENCTQNYLAKKVLIHKNNVQRSLKTLLAYNMVNKEVSIYKGGHFMYTINEVEKWTI